MPLEKEVEEAVRAIVAEKGQPESVASRLVAWLKDLSETELSRDDQTRHLDNLRRALKTVDDDDAH